MRIKIHGEWWTIRDTDDLEDYGQCVYTDRLIEIRTGQSAKVRLDTMIHEVLHAFDSEAKEKDVEAAAHLLTTVLWRDRWRRPQKDR